VREVIGSSVQLAVGERLLFESRGHSVGTTLCLRFKEVMRALLQEKITRRSGPLSVPLGPLILPTHECGCPMFWIKGPNTHIDQFRRARFMIEEKTTAVR